MRLRKVRVTRLFGLFDHEIPLNREERITIIHGPNGFGKTIVLRMIAALFSEQYALFREVPFGAFVVEFDDGRHLTVEREEGRPIPFMYLLLNLSSPEGSMTDSVKIGLSGSPEGAGVGRGPSWLPELLAEIPRVRLVRTQRLDVGEDELGFDEEGDVLAGKPTVEVYSGELSEQIRQMLATYAAHSQELDRTFPARLLSQTKAEPLTGGGASQAADRLGAEALHVGAAWFSGF